MNDELMLKEVLEGVEKLTGAEFGPLEPLSPKTSCARIVGKPVTVHEEIKVNHPTAPFVWVRYTPYQQSDPWALCPTVDLGHQFLAYLGAIEKGLQDWSRTWDFNKFYQQGRASITWFKNWITGSDLTEDERSWLIAVIEEWLADPEQVDELVNRTRQIEPEKQKTLLDEFICRTDFLF